MPYPWYLCTFPGKCEQNEKTKFNLHRRRSWENSFAINAKSSSWNGSENFRSRMCFESRWAWLRKDGARRIILMRFADRFCKSNWIDQQTRESFPEESVQFCVFERTLNVFCLLVNGESCRVCCYGKTFNLNRVSRSSLRCSIESCEEKLLGKDFWFKLIF